MKEVIFVILSIFFVSEGFQSQAQTIDPSRQCKILKRKRSGKIKFQTAGRQRRHKAPGKNELRLAKTEPRTSSITKPSRKAKKEVKEEVALAGPNVIIFNSMQMPSDDERQAIREEVAQLIAEKEDGAPIKLDPLLFKDNNGQLEITDMRPFLTAVEFGLQGRIIIIDGRLGTPQQSAERMERVRQLMINMGVNESLVSITGSPALASSISRLQIDFTVF